MEKNFVYFVTKNQVLRKCINEEDEKMFCLQSYLKIKKKQNLKNTENNFFKERKIIITYGSIKTTYK